MGGGGNEQVTTTQTSQLPSYVQPWATKLMNRAGDLANDPYKAYKGQRLAGFAPGQLEGMNMIEQRARAGSPLMNTTQGFLSSAMGGGMAPSAGANPFVGQSTQIGANPYAGANPYLEQNIKSTLDDVQGRVNAQFGNSNAFGGSASQELLSKELGKTSSAMRMQDYGMQQGLAESDINRRAQYGFGDLGRNAGLAESGLNRTMTGELANADNQLKAAAMAPGMAALDYQDAQMMLGAGDMQQAHRQDQLNLNYQNWQARQQHPYQQLDVLSNAIRGATVGGAGTISQTSPNPYQPNPYAASLGGGLLGYGVGGMFGQDYAPWGAAAGAIAPWIFGT